MAVDMAPGGQRARYGGLGQPGSVMPLISLATGGIIGEAVIMATAVYLEQEWGELVWLIQTPIMP